MYYKLLLLSPSVLRYRSSQWTRRKEDSVSACFNSTGSQLFVLRKRQPPCLFSLWEEEPLFSFFDDSGGYRNSVTMKSGCFMGQNDEVESVYIKSLA